PPSVPVPAPACGCSGHQSRINIEITETSTSFQNALGSRFFTEKKRPSYVATWFDRAGCVALRTRRSYGAEFLAAGYSPRINAPHANRSSPQPLHDVPRCSQAIFEFASSPATRFRIPRRVFFVLLSVQFFAWRAVFDSRSRRLIELLRR